jgi:hypothetical protein
MTTDGFACDLTALTPDEREHHIAHSAELFGAVPEGRELTDGFALRAPDGPDTLATLVNVADFIALDRRCCPFFRFAVVVEPYGGPIWLHITGEPGIKPVLAAELGGLLTEAVAQQAGIAAYTANRAHD